MSRQSERSAARHWVEGNESRFGMEGWKNTSKQEHEAIGRRLKATYDNASDSLPDRLRELLVELNRVSSPPSAES
jgi:hypothetical protein